MYFCKIQVWFNFTKLFQKLKNVHSVISICIFFSNKFSFKNIFRIYSRLSVSTTQQADTNNSIINRYTFLHNGSFFTFLSTNKFFFPNTFISQNSIITYCLFLIPTIFTSYLKFKEITRKSFTFLMQRALSNITYAASSAWIRIRCKKLVVAHPQSPWNIHFTWLIYAFINER